jgi:hypothetical protein
VDEIKSFRGYHGTDKKYGDEILRTKTFLPSQSDTDWLGKGIYFYIEADDAAKWCIDRNHKNPMVLCVCVKTMSDEFLDYDTKEGEDIVRSVMKVIVGSAKYAKFGEEKAAEKNQYAIAMMLWTEFPELKVLIGSFPTSPRPFPVIKDVRPLRREFCVRDNSYIHKIDVS